jgi:signal transduction histidine kinase
VPTFLSSPAVRYISLLVGLVMLGVTAVVGYLTVVRMSGSREWVYHTYLVQGKLKDLRADVFEISGLATSRASDASVDVRFQRKSGEALHLLDETETLVADNPSEIARIARLRPLLQQQISESLKCMRQEDCGAGAVQASSTPFWQLVQRRDQIAGQIQAMEDEERALLEGRLAMWHLLLQRLLWIFTAALVVALLLLIYNFRLILAELEERRRSEVRERENAESYRALSARILELQDVERRKLARELHDSVGQFLAGMKINLSQLQRRDQEAGAQSSPLLTEAIELADRAIVEIRTISHLLHPPLLDELGFYSATRWYTEGFAKRSGIHVELQLEAIAGRLPRETELALFRVLQEALTNVYRHAEASSIRVSVSGTNDRVVMTITDNGKGMPSEILMRYRAGQAGGIGLAGMQERLAERGGMFEVDCDPTGTTVRAELPANNKNADGSDGKNIYIRQG